MAPQTIYLFLFLLLAGLIAATFGIVYLSTKNPRPDWQVKSAYKLRGRFFYWLAALLVVIMLFTFSMMPYVKQHETPDVVVPVEAQMFLFNIRTPDIINDAIPNAKPKLPLNKWTEFRVTSKDVNHGFAIFSPHGNIIAQVQAMPGYVNRLRIKFNEPGTYTILCLEYCGLAHHIMKAEIGVQ